jgi:hypothetical protein
MRSERRYLGIELPMYTVPQAVWDTREPLRVSPVQGLHPHRRGRESPQGVRKLAGLLPRILPGMRLIHVLA